MSDLKTWDVVERPIYSNNNCLDSHKAIFRNDNDFLLNVCSKTYTPTTNGRFIDVVEQMSEISNYPIENYTEFQGGKKVLAFLKCTEPMTVDGHEFKDYMMIGNSHDGSTAFFVGHSNIMVRCQNRFSRQLQHLKVYHTANHDGELTRLLRTFEQFQNEKRQTVKAFTDFSKCEIDQSVKNALMQRLADMTVEERTGVVEMSTRKRNIFENLQTSIERETLALGNNAFGLLQGVTHYTTHLRNNREKVFCSAMGGAARLNKKAFEFCEELTYN